jgi:hypothetical protein
VSCSAAPARRSGGSLYLGSACGELGRDKILISGSVGQDRRRDYADNVLTVIQSSPELLQLGGELARLYGEMELTQKRYISVKPGRGSTRPVGVNPRGLL